MRAYTYMSKQEIDKSYFHTFCIEQFKQSHHVVWGGGMNNVNEEGKDR